ncbi:hypothetical protein FED02_07755 [Staphylococcus epidermidis]|uniref:Uncharacterized protein n=1 Tax=Staphylococcus epidermidis (strain ATCC 35984 / DSM 28319 / BCRC 17069 / CCUG 31568 / BM 3577 / RP62A) TaxID=176279 RepID=Q5HKS6_STAEQ|nr:hypothetical protein SERP2266 [Staphylococcus epidermidis RP62A]KAB2213329.1 hypothetical protein F9B19_01860 [Staphylococcus epidermidis]PIH18103.1 hypothetical protein CTI93_01315 [Staphylococcus epidermidis]RLY71257.1 hypothetical protein D9V09_07430 [Staphylococcus epidermidis]TLP20923.1 hypothetical protein FED02_07755 [Staphylococcus epidermidis]
MKFFKKYEIDLKKDILFMKSKLNERLEIKNRDCGSMKVYKKSRTEFNLNSLFYSLILYRNIC